LEPRVRALQTELEELGARINAAERLADSRAAVHIAAAILGGYAQSKTERAALDYDDLIRSAVALLTRGEARDWVRYKLDGGVEHILVDEAQDTSPEQWRAIEALSEEFFAGRGAFDDRGPSAEPGAAEGAEPHAPPLDRTIFAVGDEKQSIYSFQGAAPELLSEKRRAFEMRSAAAAREHDPNAPSRFASVTMGVSFRSAPAVLRFVDRVFAPEEARRGLSFEANGEGPVVRHTAHRAAAPGQVDLWPVLPAADKTEEPPWDAPVDAPAADDPRARLAELVADEIVGWIGREPLPARGRAIRAGDVLVLLRQREPFSPLIIKALKSRGAPVAGADRLSLTEELAVKDLLALAQFCLAPDDDLAVATLLRSPFCDVDEEGLFRLAHYRPGRRRLFYELQARRAEHPAFEAAYGFLAAMLKRADFARPYELFAHALGPLDGRRRLVARLGAEAEDAIDELLAEALRFERSGGPTLEAFALRMSQRAIEIKREHEQGRDEIRVMTAHGAKGLEAPVVVMPDTCGAPSSGGGRGGAPVLLDPSKFGDQGAGRTPPPIWAGRSADDPEALAALREAIKAREAEEHRRLLYVALTRAEDRLLICGARSAPEGSWHALCAAAFEADSAQDGSWGDAGAAQRVATPVDAAVRGSAAEPGAGSAGLGWRLVGAGTPARREATRPPRAPAPKRAPAWFWRPVVQETAAADIRPSDLGGEDEEQPDAAEQSRAAPRLRRDVAASRGVVIHRLLERLAALPPAARPAAAERILRETGAHDASWAEGAVAEALAVLDAPELAALFGPGSRAEVPFAAILPALGPGEIHGVIDRVVVEPRRVLIVDFKTGAAGMAEATPPEPYLRQLAVYRAAMRPLFPGRPVETALLWTASRSLAHISESAVDAALERAATALDPLRAAS
ncbi:MAG: UvrD-helicase domain-containing protein, partial [Pseudomonadota bacterium]